MEVAGLAENETVAILGGGKAHTFGMLVSSHSVRMLSNTLYANKKLACVREVVCNAVDAHLKGNVERPVEIQVTPTAFIVRDFGAGIDARKFEAIATTYFYSDKSEDHAQTGGFGLGFKSPFAVSDHFSVINRNSGRQYAYTMSINGEDNSGLPMSRLMGSTPTKETGVTVTVPIVEGTQQEYLRLVRKIVNEGGMNAVIKMPGLKPGDMLKAFDPDEEDDEDETEGGELRTERLDPVDWSGLKEHGYAFWVGSTSGSRVLFGNVLYDLDDNQVELKEDIFKIKLFSAGRDLVIYAPPSSIVPQPNREGLSYESKTVNALKPILARARRELEALRKPAIIAELRRRMAGKTVIELLHFNGGGVNTGRKDPLTVPVCAGAAAIVERFAHGKVDNARIGYSDRYGLDKETSRLAQIVAISTVKDNKRAFRLWQEIPPKVKEGFGRGQIRVIPADVKKRELDAETETVRYSIRRIARVLSADPLLLKNLLYRGSNFARLVKVINMERGQWLPLSLTVCHTRNSILGTQKTGFFVYAPNLTEERIETLRRRAGKLGIAFDVIEKPEPVKRPKKEVPIIMGPHLPPEVEIRTYHPLAFNEVYLNHEKIKVLRANELIREVDRIEKPQAFFAAAWSGRKFRGFQFQDDHNRSLVLRHLNRVVPGIVIPESNEELAELIEAKVPDVHDVLLAIAKKRLTKPKPYELHYLTASRLGKRTYTHNLDEAAKLARIDRSMADLVLGQKHRPHPDRDFAYSFWMAAERMFDTSTDHLTEASSARENYVAAKAEYEKIVKAFAPDQGKFPNAIGLAALEEMGGFITEAVIQHRIPLEHMVSTVAHLLSLYSPTTKKRKVSQ